VESQNFESRKNVLKYDDVMNRQREVIYAERRRVLEGADLHDQIRTFIDDVVAGYVMGATTDFAEQWDLEALWTALGQLYPISLSLEKIEADAGGRAGISREVLVEDITQDAQAAYDRREAEVGPDVMRELERRVILSVLDRKWREHLYEMDYLREGIYLRAYSQRDPLVEYQREGFDMFAAMMDGIKEESVGFLFNLQVEVDEDDDADAGEVDHDHDHEHEVAAAPAPGAIDMAAAASHAPQIRAKGLERERKPQRLAYSAPSEDGEAEVTGAAPVPDEYAGVGRNADCPCGSGKKFKKCHGAPGGPTGLTTRVNG
jgi:preprotein translocase subunit SecA